MRCRILELSEYSGRARANKDFCRSQSLNNAETAVQAIGYSGNVDEKRETLAHPTAGEKAVFRFQGAHHCASGGRRRVGIWGLGFKGGCCAGAGSEVGAMFTTAVLWARRSSGLRPGKLNNLGEHVESASQTLYKILENHGPITVTDCWNHAAQVTIPAIDFYLGRSSIFFCHIGRGVMSNIGVLVLCCRWRVML